MAVFSFSWDVRNSSILGRPPVTHSTGPMSFFKSFLDNLDRTAAARGVSPLCYGPPKITPPVCPSIFRLVLVELVSDWLLPLQPRPHPLLQGVLRPPLPGHLCFGVTLLTRADRTRD